jgi:hypothetical protein
LTTSSPLTECPRCSQQITFGDVVGTSPIDEMLLAVGLLCPTCGLGCHLRVERAKWDALLDRSDGQKRSQSMSDAPGGGSVDGRLVGRTVKGFAEVELSPPSLSVGDLLLRWDYQAKVAPDTIPREEQWVT